MTAAKAAGYARGVREAAEALKRGAPGSMLAAEVDGTVEYILAMLPAGDAS